MNSVSSPLSAVFIGCTEFSDRVLRHLLSSGEVAVAGVVTRESSRQNSDFKSHRSLAEEYRIPWLSADRCTHDDLAGWIRALRPDAVFCMGWSYLLDPQVLAVPRFGVIGYHPASLPRNRGRHPIIWALALGLTETASTFLQLDGGVDSGPIVAQTMIPIFPEDDAGSLYERLNQAARTQVIEIARSMRDGSFRTTPQDHVISNSWRRRRREDGRIDWRMPAQGIVNLVRALTHPYPGAHVDWNGTEVKVWKTTVGKRTDQNLEPGRVLAVERGQVTVKCGDGSVILIDHGFESVPSVGEYL